MRAVSLDGMMNDSPGALGFTAGAPVAFYGEVGTCMTTFTRSIMALATVTLMAGGCAYGHTTMDDAAMSNDRTVVRVTNNNWSDMTIYLVRSGARQRLGTVTSQSTDTFVVPSYILSSSAQVYLMADPIGSTRTFTSAPVLIHPGQTAEWQLENSLALSSMWVR
jgi:uncharacterized cupredoxin-like copper-binding protein